MHAELVSVCRRDLCGAVDGARARGGRVVAVGTTVVRALEIRGRGRDRCAPFAGETRLFIMPGYRFRVVDALLTNFHLPESTLLMLVCAFAGREHVLAAYRHAVAARYRFFSYGDAMFVDAGTRRARPRACSRMNSSCWRADGAARRGRLTSRTARRDAGVHAGRHLRHGQGDDARGARRARRRRSSSATRST